MNPSDTEWLLRVFKKSNFFSGFSDTELGELIDHMERANYAKGETIITEGDQGEWFFVVYKGTVSVSVKKWMFRTEKVGTLHPEDFFGEMALVSNRPRAATIVAEEDTVCFMLFKSSFQNLVEKSESFKQGIENLIKERSKQSG